MTTPAQPTPSYRIHCRMTPEAAALERLCQVVRIRGFRIAKMVMDSGTDGLNIELTLEGSRPINMLRSQLEKLHTVNAVHLGEHTAMTTASKSA